MEENSKPPKPAEPAAPNKKWENVILWLFIAALLIASVVAAYLFWEKLSEQLP